MNDPREGLKRFFGFDDFRGRQRDVIDRVMTGESGLVIFPTGEGKSLCYQLPALLADGLTIVLSPLIALMQDQVDALRSKGLPATFINSSIDRKTREKRLAAARRGEVKLLYVTPERFRVEAFLDGIAKCPVSFLAVDEAHCVSQWGHDFRPDYARVGEIRAKLGDPPVLALTATATPDVQRDILEKLRVPDAWVIHTGIERDNLLLTVRDVDTDEEKTEHVVARATALGGPGIVYLALIRDLLHLETELKRRGLKPLIYHGDLAPEERRAMHERFMEMENPLILATNAFGMGVDKPNIRFILHHQIPRTLEAYYQEVGRAGRDGKGSLCELLFREEDVLIQKEFTEWANPGLPFIQSVIEVLERNRYRWSALEAQDIRETLLIKNRRDGRIETVLNLLETAGCTTGQLGRGTFELVRTPEESEIRTWVHDDKRERDLGHLLDMMRYAKSPSCRKGVLHAHFGFGELEGGCGACDHCVDADAWLEEHLPPEDRRPIEAPKPTETAKPTGGDGPTGGGGLKRGDWIDLERFGHGMVTRVEGQGRRTRIEVELTSTMKKRRFWLDRIRWKKL